MKLNLQNVKGTNDYLPEEQYIRNNIKNTLENIFLRYGCKPLETPILNYYEIMASKYAGGAEILKEIYSVKNQGDRDIVLRYDLTIPFTKVVGMNPNLRMPFKRYEIGKVFRDGPVKKGRFREFNQCDVDIVGIKSVMAEAELVTMAIDAFDELGLDVYISYNNRKLLSGMLYGLDIKEELINSVILTLDKIEKLSKDEIIKELKEKNVSDSSIDKLFKIIDAGETVDLSYFENNELFKNNTLIEEGIAELKELEEYLNLLGIKNKTKFNQFLARGLDIYTGTVYEIFLKDNSITSSIGGGGRYDKIIGKFLDDGKEYPAVGISFGLDVIFTALSLKDNTNIKSSTKYYIIPLGAEKECLKIAQKLRKKGESVEIEMNKRRLRNSLDYANKENIPYVLILGEDELTAGQIQLKDMEKGTEEYIKIEDLWQLGTVLDCQLINEKY